MDSKVYKVQDIQKILCLSKSTAYDYIRKVYKENKPFRVIKIGGNYRIQKDSFDEWFHACP